ncbi:MAG TPA: hypothetical protein VF382_03635, partial [Actinomycetota bacterium]
MRIRYSEWDGTQGYLGSGIGVVHGDPGEDWEPMEMFVPSGGGPGRPEVTLTRVLRQRARARSSGLFGSIPAVMRQARAVRSRRLNLEGSLEDIDEDALREAMGEAAVIDLRALMSIERAGLVNARRGRLEVTPKGARKLGDRALAQMYRQLRRDKEGTRASREIGGLAEPT